MRSTRLKCPVLHVCAGLEVQSHYNSLSKSSSFTCMWDFLLVPSLLSWSLLFWSLLSWSLLPVTDMMSTIFPLFVG